MSFVHYGSSSRRAPKGAIVDEHLRPGTYTMEYNPMSGYYYEQLNEDLETREAKVYGRHPKIARKIYEGFKRAEGNFGVLLEGQKGTGKTLTARAVAELAKEDGVPVIIVSKNMPGLVDEIAQMDTPAMFLFDEFEKVFPKSSEDNPQDEFLPLLDGIYNHKHLYVLTVNESNRLSPYLLGRPGRIHYAFKYEETPYQDIVEYVEDRYAETLSDADRRQVALFAFINGLAFDMIRAICSEMAQGYSMEETINDLNLDLGTSGLFNVTASVLDSETDKVTQIRASVHFSPTGRSVNIEDHVKDIDVNFYYPPESVQIDATRSSATLVVPKDVVNHVHTYGDSNEKRYSLVSDIRIERYSSRTAVNVPTEVEPDKSAYKW